MTNTATRRCFIGLAPDEATCKDVHAQVNAVLDREDWKLHDAEDLHLTLCFLGDTSEARLPALQTLLRAGLRSRAVPQLKLEGVGSFGDSEAPRVLWVGVTATAYEIERLLALRRAAARALEMAAMRWDSAGNFTPHVTVARPRKARPAPEAFHALDFDIVWRPVEVVLFATVAGARPHYPRIASFPLAAGG